MKREFLLDIETFPNYTLFLFTQRTGQSYKFEIWKRTNTAKTQMPKFIRGLTEEDVVYSYNGNRFDLVILEKFLENVDKWDQQAVADLAQDIIYGETRYWRPKFHFRQADMQEILNLNKQEQIDGKASKRFVSLKEAAANIGYAEIKDLPADPDFDLTPQQKKEVYEYCFIDHGATWSLVDWAQKELDMREGMSEEHGLDLLNYGEPRLAKKVLTHLYRKLTGNSAYDLKDRRWGKTEEELDENLAKLWYDYSKFIPSRNQFKWVHSEFSELYEEMAKFGRYHNAIKKESKFNHEVIIGDNAFMVGEGGLHSSMDSKGAWRSDEKANLYQVDASSFYPFLVENRNLYPKHLPGYGPLFWGIVLTRLAHKRDGHKVAADRQKIIINAGGFGLMKDKYSPFFDPHQFMSVTLTGQLYMLQIIDWFLKVGVEIILANTDGIMVRVPVELEEPFRKVVAFFSKAYKLTMDIDDLSLVVKKNVNSYLLVGKDGEIVKGTKDFKAKPHPKSPMSGMIVAKSLVAYFHKGIPVEKTIMEADNILDFLYVKSSGKKSWRVTIQFPWADAPVLLQNTQRWYVSKRGGYMRRDSINSTKGEAIMKGTRVMPLLKIDDWSVDAYGDLDKEWYVKEATKKLNEILE